MKAKNIAVFLALLWSILPAMAWGAELQTPAAIAELSRWLAQRQQDSGVVGVSAALVVDGKVVWKQGFGYADKNAGIAMTPSTQVGIGSVTKTFTALAAMQLQEQGLVDIDQPLSRYLPEFRIRTHGEDRGQVTLRRLITHSSGVPTDVFRDMQGDQARYTDVVTLLNRTALAHSPGTVGLYSNVGYNLLGHALAKASGIDYPDYLKQRIFAPLRMKNTGFAGDPHAAGRSKAYGPDGAEAAVFELRDIASGGIYSTAEDLAAYAAALMDAYHGAPSPLVKEATIRSMFTLQTDIPIDTNKKGLGWFLFRNDDRFAAYHAGSTFYSNAAVLLIPEQKTAAVILANTVGGDAVCEQFAFRWLESHGLSVKDIVPEPAPLPVSSDTPRSRHAGYYAQKNGYAKVEETEAGLSIRRDAETYPATETSPGVFAVQAAGEADGDLYYFRDIGPYHVLFWRRGQRERQLGYHIPDETLGSEWKQRLGRYRPFGYTMPGFEKIAEAEVRLQDDGLPVLRVSYNTGTFTYPMVPVAADETRTGGLGPSMTGDAVSFGTDAGSEVMTYLGLTFRKD